VFSVATKGDAGLATGAVVIRQLATRIGEAGLKHIAAEPLC
jgi:hypothetical protein